MYELITGKENLLGLIESGVIDALPENVGTCSIDVRLDKELMIESNIYDATVDIMNKQYINMQPYIMNQSGYCLTPSSFCKGKLKETIVLPDNMVARFTLRSAVAQNGIGHALSDMIRKSWSGQLVLELNNSLKYHNWILREDLLIGQLQFFLID
ncbi:MAG: dCTP deaminase domain-containing protein [Methanobacterium sp.]